MGRQWKWCWRRRNWPFSLAYSPTNLQLFLINVLCLLPFTQASSHKKLGLPRQFECYSCMSLIYQDNWQFLQLMYTAPKVFTNRLQRAIDPKKHSNGAVWICMCHFAGAQCRSWCVPRLQVHKGL
uniref:Secreted protein n=1 Tax=Ditylenchus dipsaci TaxID=166011 RepID=A0A915DPK6_9BILA